MSIFFRCVCGLELECLVAQAGYKVMCPKCRSDLTVPPRSTTYRPEPVPDLGIVVASGGPILTKARRPRHHDVPRRPVSSVAVIALAVLGFLAMAGGGFLVAALVAWGLIFAPGRPEEGRLHPAAIEAAAPDPTHAPAPAPASDRTPSRAELELGARIVLEEKDARLREAVRILHPGLYTVLDSSELPNDRFAFLLQDPDKGTLFSRFVDHGIASRDYASGDRFYWETATPRELAIIWASERSRGPAQADLGDFQVKGYLKRAFDLKADLIDRKTGRRFHLSMNGFHDSGIADIKITGLDQ